MGCMPSVHIFIRYVLFRQRTLPFDATKSRNHRFKIPSHARVGGTTGSSRGCTPHTLCKATEMLVIGRKSFAARVSFMHPHVAARRLHGDAVHIGTIDLLLRLWILLFRNIMICVVCFKIYLPSDSHHKHGGLPPESYHGIVLNTS